MSYNSGTLRSMFLIYLGITKGYNVKLDQQIAIWQNKGREMIHATM